jgi:4-carboxymuconolactone decarboxylase
MLGDFAPKLAELTEAITHVTLYAGWPNGMAAMGVAKTHFTEQN